MGAIFLEYFYWHYSIAPFEILRIMGDYLKGARHQFLIVRHLRTLFAPWHRQNPSDFGRQDKTFTDKILDAMADIYIRLIAAGVRIFIITIGLAWQLVLFIFFVLLFVIWLAWPLLAGYLVINGINRVLP